MHDASPLTAWSNFYVITGSSAAALTGLMFVAITLVAGDRTRRSSEGVSTFSSPTVAHFCAALAVSVTLSAPWRSLAHAAIVVASTAAYGIGYALYILARTRGLRTYEPAFDDWIRYIVVPLAIYVTIAVAALRLAATPTQALFTLAAAVMLLIFLGIHNAWDVVTYIAVNPDSTVTTAGEAEHDGAPAQRPPGDAPAGDHDGPAPATSPSTARAAPAHTDGS